jgi:DmsE family decaheme c-type cytochrome
VVALLLPLSALAQTPAAKPAASEQLPAGYAGAEACKGCHEDAFTKFEGTRMGRLFLKQPRNMAERLACESCHGPGKEHVDAGGGKGKGGMITFAKNDPTPIDKRNQACLSCHTKGGRLFWQGSTHESRDVACTSCHRVMEAVSRTSQLAKPTQIETCGTCHLQKRAAQMRYSRHPIDEGKMNCSSCHNPHGTPNVSLLREPTPNDTCYRCHTEKRGPYLYEHAPVVESCSNCHEPHGTAQPNMLKAPLPRLCQACHIETRHPTSPYGPKDPASARFVFGRACNSCHVTIHGSNHPSGFGFTR